MNPDTKLCNKENCKIAETGVCLEGFHNLEECPHLDKANEEISEAVAELAEATIELPRVFYHGRALNIKEANSVTRDLPTRLIILAGEIESGKTTLLAEIYESFQRAPFAGFFFSSSQTLLGFEQRCHLSRVSSGASSPNTSRTREMDPELLHLGVKETGSDGIKTNLLFTDLSGERFEMIRNSTDECRRLKILARADHFSLLIDGKAIVDKKHRQKAYEDCRSLLRSTLDAEMLGVNTYVEIVFTKLDVIKSQKGEEDFISAITKKISDEFNHKFAGIDFFQIAARSHDIEACPTGFMVDKLLKHWVTYGSESE